VLVRRGIGDAGAGPGVPWQCGWIPFYAGMHPDVCSDALSPKPPAPPVIPAGSLDPNQTPVGPAGGGAYSVDQVIGDTSAIQRSQTQQFFSDLAAQLSQPAPCDPSAFWCNYKNLVILAAVAVGGLIVVNLAKGAVR
jgi:hypothetical protein